MNWKYVMASACFIGALLAGGCGKPFVHVMTVKMEKVPFAMETRVVPEALHIAPVIPSVSGVLFRFAGSRTNGRSRGCTLPN
ncbi:MAG: hypothetical protein ACLRP4_06220 [Dialister invisus]